MTDLFINPDRSPERVQLEQRYIDFRLFLSTQLDPYERGKVCAGLMVAAQTLSADALRAEIAACVKLIRSCH
jgi:hypothetical protein